MRSKLTIALLATVAACGGGEGDSATAVPPVTLAVTGRSNENVSLAAAGPLVVAVWSASISDTTDIFAAVSRDAGAVFSAPVRVNVIPGQARAGGEQPPRVALIPRAGDAPEIVVLWTTRTPAGTRLLSARSTDGGTTFGASVLVPGSDGAGNRGWESLAVGDSGRAIALWLDHRNTAPAMATSHKHGQAAPAKGADAPKPDPVERAGLSQLWAGSLDGAVAAYAITGGVCYCCKTSLVASGQNVYAAWRHVFPGNQRDIAFVASRDGGKTFGPVVRVSEDRWQFDGCPENGPALAVDTGGRVHVAWVTPLAGAEGGPLTLYHASSVDGAAFTPRVKIETTGPAGHVQLTTLGSGNLVMAWDEVVAGSRRVRAARGVVAADGRAEFSPLAVGDHAGMYPALASAAGTAGGFVEVMAWVDRSAAAAVIKVAVLEVR